MSTIPLTPDEVTDILDGIGVVVEESESASIVFYLSGFDPLDSRQQELFARLLQQHVNCRCME